MLVCAFGEWIRCWPRIAMRWNRNIASFSYGDAMLIEKRAMNSLYIILRARPASGTLDLAHGKLETPASCRSALRYGKGDVARLELKDMGAQIVLGNNIPFVVATGD